MSIRHRPLTQPLTDNFSQSLPSDISACALLTRGLSQVHDPPQSSRVGSLTKGTSLLSGLSISRRFSQLSKGCSGSFHELDETDSLPVEDANEVVDEKEIDSPTRGQPGGEPFARLAAASASAIFGEDVGSTYLSETGKISNISQSVAFGTTPCSPSPLLRGNSSAAPTRNLSCGPSQRFSQLGKGCSRSFHELDDTDSSPLGDAKEGRDEKEIDSGAGDQPGGVIAEDMGETSRISEISQFVAFGTIPYSPSPQGNSRQ